MKTELMLELMNTNPKILVAYILISLIVTIICYCAFPILFALLRKKYIPQKKYRTLCYVFNFFIMILFYLGDSELSIPPYILWTSIFIYVGSRILYKKALLGNSDIEIPEDNPNLGVKCKSCGYISTQYFEACPQCGKHAKEYIPIHVYPNHSHQSQTFDPTTGKLRFCRYCGAELVKDSRFCIKCGASVYGDPGSMA